MLKLIRCWIREFVYSNANYRSIWINGENWKQTLCFRPTLLYENLTLHKNDSPHRRIQGGSSGSLAPTIGFAPILYFRTHLQKNCLFASLHPNDPVCPIREECEKGVGANQFRNCRCENFFSGAKFISRECDFCREQTLEKRKYREGRQIPK